MARSKEFEVDDAVQRAMLAFWRRGYRGTSVRDLCDAMDLGPGSFYATFGSKADLFRLALRRYLVRLDLGPPGPDAIRRYFERVVADRDPTGCLLVGSAVERDALEEDARALVTEGTAGLEDFFWASLGAGADARRNARTLVATAIGIQVLHRSGVDRGRLVEIVDHALSGLDIPRATQ